MVGSLKYSVFFLFLSSIASLLPFRSYCQSPVVSSAIDKKVILIGEQMVLTVRGSFPIDSPLPAMNLRIPDSIPHFEVIEKTAMDTVTFRDNSRTLEQKLIFTSFDSGQWVLPSFQVLIGQTGGAQQVINTDSMAIDVGYSPADSTNQLRDIKPIKEVSLSDPTAWYIAGGILLLLLIGLFAWYYYKKKRSGITAGEKNGLTPLQEAMNELAELDRYNLSVPVEIKAFHTRLSRLFKRYLGRKQSRPVDQYTTSELLINLDRNHLTPEGIASLADALRCADAVKFAKYLPAPDLSMQCREQVKQTINRIEQLSINHKISA